VAPRPGQWESYDVTAVGRNVTVACDGVTIIDIHPGHHTGGMKYRNITVSLAKQ